MKKVSIKYLFKTIWVDQYWRKIFVNPNKFFISFSILRSSREVKPKKNTQKICLKLWEMCVCGRNFSLSSHEIKPTKWKFIHEIHFKGGRCSVGIFEMFENGLNFAKKTLKIENNFFQQFFKSHGNFFS